jgi:hypothetical protein
MDRLGQERAVPHPVGTTIRRVEGGGHYILAVLAHAGIALGFFGVGFLASLAISVLIWLFSKRSRYLYFHSEQAGLYQLLVFLINIADALILLGLGVLFWHIEFGPDAPAPSSFTDLLAKLGAIIEYLMLPLLIYLVWFVGSILYGVFGAIMVAAGREFSYPWIGNYIKRKMKRRRE